MDICRDIYTVIASFLGEIETLRCLERLCSTSHDLIVDRTNINAIKLASDKFMTSVSIGYIDGVSYYYNEEKIEEAMLQACKHNILPVAKFLYKHGREHIDIPMGRIFTMMCTHGHCNIAQWIHSLGCVKNPANRFIYACAHGNLDVAQWIFRISHIPVADIEEAYVIACYHDYLPLVQWLYSLRVVTSHTQNIAHNLAHDRANDDILQWLYSTNTITL